MNDLTSTDLRCRPRQRRSIATFELVLDTAADLLETHGMAAFTTNLLSETSGVSVRAIYRYFPNKHAVVAELAQRMATRWRDAVAEVGDLADPTKEFDELWPAYLRSFVAAVRSTPGGRAVLAAMRDDRELRAIDDAANRGYIDGIVSALVRRRPSLDPKQARATATVLMRSTVAVLDDALVVDDSWSSLLVDTLADMHRQLLHATLDDSTVEAAAVQRQATRGRT